MSDELTGDKAQFVTVGIGASAGGLEALEAFFGSMPPTDKFAFVVVQHLSPDYKSLMGELLTKHTSMPIYEAEDGMEVRPGAIFLSPGKSNMTVYRGRLFLTPQEHGLNLPIDLFLTSLAEDRGEASVGIVLSGTGSDGTRGVRAIKEAGGVVMVQDEDSAKFNGMPRSAIATGIVDYVLPPDRLAAELQHYAAGDFKLTRALDETMPRTGTALAKILMLVKRKTGVDLSFYKETTIIRRIERRMAINQIKEIERYISFLEEFPQEVSTLFKEILIGVTRFFRDPEAFDVLADRVIPALINGKSGTEPIRIWVAACSTGEEAYSLAILVQEFLEEHELSADVKIFATDIDKAAIEVASHGAYPESIAADASRERLAKYFLKRGDTYQVTPKIREMVIFAYHNVFKDPPFRRIDLVSCRNLLIYLQPILQKKVLANFHFSLSSRGYVFLGNSETIGDYSKYFKNVDVRWKIYQATGEAAEAARSQGDGRLEVPVRRPFARADHGIGSFDTPTQKPTATVFERLIESRFPPTVIINENREIQHIFGDVSPYLTLPLGRMDLDILKMAGPQVSVALGSAIQTATKDLTEVTFQGIGVGEGDREHTIDLTVTPIRGVMDQRYFAILFTRVEEAAARGTRIPYNVDETMKRRIAELESELKYTKENLQATIEELETSNEELQATNEELLSSNEELQSTNEELQSVNEELITVNAEYQKKIEELSQLSSDVDNLLSGSDIGTIFLDMNLTIRKFTPPAERFVKVIKTDVGRPIGDLSVRFAYDRFLKDLEEVVGGGEARDVEAQRDEGGWVLVRIRPYEETDAEAGGVVVTFIDITQRKQAELALVRQSELLTNILEASPAATTMVDAKGRLVFANHRAAEVLGQDRDELMSLKFNSPSFRITDCEGNDIPADELPFSELMETKREVSGYVHCIERADGTTVRIRVTGSPVFGEDGTVEGGVFTLDERVDEGC